MRVLLIGGTGFTGPPLVRELLGREHDVVLLHRGQTHDPRTAGAREVIADRKERGQLAAAISDVRPDIVVDMIPMTEDDALHVKSECAGVVRRVVVLSSIDVYLAFGRIHRTEPGPLQPTPLLESSALRETNLPAGPSCDKPAVERVYLSDADPAATILRLSAIYGPRDKYRRTRGYLKRMDDGRPAILLGERVSQWRFSRGFVDNVAHAIVAAIENENAAGEIYNVAEPEAMTELEFVQAIACAADWSGEVKMMPDEQLPEHLQSPVNFSQNWEVDTQKIRRELGYTEVIGRNEAFQRTVAWERAQPPDVEPFLYDYESEDKALAGLVE